MLKVTQPPPEERKEKKGKKGRKWERKKKKKRTVAGGPGKGNDCFLVGNLALWALKGSVKGGKSCGLGWGGGPAREP